MRRVKTENETNDETRQADGQENIDREGEERELNKQFYKKPTATLLMFEIKILE